MVEWKVGGTRVQQGAAGRDAAGRSGRRGRVFGFVVLGALLGACLIAGRGVAQAQDQPEPTMDARLTVRPHEAATATRTAQAGEFSLDSLPDYLVYVPQKCVGSQRCPLVVQFAWQTRPPKEMIDLWRPVAEKYGIIVLAPKQVVEPGFFFTTEPNRSNLDIALTQVLGKYAVDPDKIAAISREIRDVVILGTNSNVFSRVIMGGGDYPNEPFRPQKKGVQLLADLSMWFLRKDAFLVAQELRQAGYHMDVALTFRWINDFQVEDVEFNTRWLLASWATPDPAARPAPAVVADPLPLLTSEAAAQMTIFWTSFKQKPDSIKNAARLAHLHEVVVPVGKEQPQPLLWMTDMAALAAQYPSVAEDLKKAGLTAQQHDAYRVAIVSALATRVLANDPDFTGPAGVLEANSVLAKNVVFYEEHREEFKRLFDHEKGMWNTP